MLRRLVGVMRILVTALPYWWIADTWWKLDMTPVVDFVGVVVIGLSIPQYALVIKKLESLIMVLFRPPGEVGSELESTNGGGGDKIGGVESARNE